MDGKLFLVCIVTHGHGSVSHLMNSAHLICDVNCDYLFELKANFSKKPAKKYFFSNDFLVVF